MKAVIVSLIPFAAGFLLIACHTTPIAGSRSMDVVKEIEPSLSILSTLDEEAVSPPMQVTGC